MTNWKEELKKYLKEQGEPVGINEIFTDDSFTIQIRFKNVPWMQSNSYVPDVDKSKIENETYAFLLRELRTTKEEREANKAFMDQWLYNIQNNIGDARGETIPSNKQVMDRLKNNA